MSDEQGRKAFEAWARPKWTHPEDFDQRIKAARGTYNSIEVQAAWRAWQESRRVALEEAAQIIENEIGHAETNNTRLPPDLSNLQGAPAVRSQHLAAAVEAIRALASKTQEGS